MFGGQTPELGVSGTQFRHVTYVYEQGRLWLVQQPSAYLTLPSGLVVFTFGR